MPPFPQFVNLSHPMSRRTRFCCAVQGILICCLCAIPPAPHRALAQDPTEDYAAPLQPADWELDDWRLYRLRYTTSLKSEPRLSTEDKTNLTRGVEYYLYGMTMPTPPGGQSIVDLRRNLLTDLRSIITKNPARTHLLEEIVRIAPELLDQPPGPRLNVIILLSSLATNQTPDPEVPYVPANEILLNVINDPDQLVQCKIWAAVGLARITRDGNPNITIKNRIANDLVEALDSPEARTDPASENSADWWYRMRLLEALGDNGLPVNVNGEPVVIDAMTQMIVDPDEHWRIRSTAARMCTQLKWDSGTNVSLINWVICRLLHEMAQKYNQQLARDNAEEAPYWRGCFFNIYLSYRPLTAQQKQRGWGLLQQAGARAAEVQAAYQVVLPVINAVTRDFNPQSIPQPAIDALDGWLQNNKPDNWKVTPGSDELSVSGSPAEGPTTTTLGPGPGEVPDTQRTGAVIDPSGS